MYTPKKKREKTEIINKIMGKKKKISEQFIKSESGIEREREGGVKEKMYCHFFFLNHICEQTIYLCVREKEKEIKDKRLKTKKRKEKAHFFFNSVNLPETTL